MFIFFPSPYSGGYLAHVLLSPVLGRGPDWPDLSLVTAVGRNDSVHKVVSRGVMEVGEEVHATWCSAIDIQARIT